MFDYEIPTTQRAVICTSLNNSKRCRLTRVIMQMRAACAFTTLARTHAHMHKCPDTRSTLPHNQHARLHALAHTQMNSRASRARAWCKLVLPACVVVHACSVQHNSAASASHSIQLASRCVHYDYMATTMTPTDPAAVTRNTTLDITLCMYSIPPSRARARVQVM